MAPETLKWLIGGGVSLLAGAFALLFRVAYKLGESAKVIEKIGEDMKTLKERADAVPLLQQRVTLVENVAAKISSDIKDLLRRSHPYMNGRDDE